MQLQRASGQRAYERLLIDMATGSELLSTSSLELNIGLIDAQLFLCWLVVAFRLFDQWFPFRLGLGG